MHGEVSIMHSDILPEHNNFHHSLARTEGLGPKKLTDGKNH